ncbi:hypothetical protein EV191_1011339 [Tamaricihabitans halophyticus]|uniref:Uncharacterized protein n=1 Tax=Tamaricihabitans halophyticus TaxID=1262583 RepID=A0A4R2R5U0_9PSEU|nr:hypothetical protein [Tamaricihabitans halophyticus]TCP57384.1 hypothetical protein EV191_1011339 [Tamaricihabitans halophyticus]
MRRARRAIAAGAVGFLAAGIPVLVTSGGTAMAAPAPIIVGECGATVQGKPGQPIALDVGAAMGKEPGSLGTVALGTVQDGNRTIGLPVAEIVDGLGGLTSPIPIVGDLVNGLRGLVGGVCNVTTDVVNTAAKPVQSAASPVTKPLGDVAEQGLNAIDPPQESGPGPNQPAPENPGPNQPGPNQPPGQDSLRPVLPTPDGGLSEGLDAQGLQDFTASFGYSPMTDYSSLPFDSAGLYAPSPGVRYGGQVPGFAPEFGILGEEGNGNGQDKESVRNAGQAQAVQAPTENNVTLPVLLGALLLTGVLAGLVRTWVLRRTAG